ncbi:MAG: hypothetical protein A2365_01925 [Candidatus Nealsonbacteria bacterium RIFOXYB1_FULL_40_15]|uniref:NADP-dependent oxidoreductase domain-containing protein n=2 Tax=Candidatus Nealsoniibacteriota TaxID=1817911 RepID=A0A1G2ETP5_9BACT|nr:MAG: hypothetical protein A2365_01925 [Candidatus Nealsonbacteria bacterium RIFOXYB1_FULL_40_15]OGZ29113.1 MAG: hypothetical protein A2427_02375 [Candidatus Nealsonbacteria bacterium RIFOXYC1_FULL_40_7]OGZ29354.1 MAG: hypothetical protein A2562_01195 [Candidatus Nealsonbacteria bacterium RIFOXYD1_FULL_39_11]
MLKQKEIPFFKLNNRSAMPIIGFGTGSLKGEDAFSSVKFALEAGYRHIDTADIYENHREIGRAIKESLLSRRDIFITTKYHDSLSENVKDSLDRFLRELRTTYIDLLLLHRPAENSNSIGVSNFSIEQLNEALHLGFEISNNQIEFHPSLNERELQNFCSANRVVVTAYSPLGQGKDLSIKAVEEIAEKHDVEPSNAILAWHIQRNRAAIPSSKNKDHIKENLESLSVELSEDELEKIDKIGEY